MVNPELILKINEENKGDSPEIKIMVTGDLYPGNRVENLLIGSTESNRNLREVVEKLSLYDLRITNLESPLTYHNTPIIKSGPNLKASLHCARGIKDLGFDVVSLANNHILDMGDIGLQDTLEVCKNEGLKVMGAGLDLKEASQPLVLIIQGVSISIIGLTEREFSIAKKDSAGACPLDPIENFYQIKEARKKTDFVLVLLHGGNEYYPFPSPRMQKICRFFVEAGANAVICNHIHVPSGYEIFHDAPIVYSTGNLLFDWLSPRPIDWYQGYTVGLSVIAGAVLQMVLSPYWQCRKEIGLSFMENEEAYVFLEKIIKKSEIIKDDTLLSRNWNDYCQSKKNDYLSSILSLTTVERRLLKMGLWPIWRLNRKNLPEILNILSCESRLDLLQHVIEIELVERYS
jgi:hypothetical protein